MAFAARRDDDGVWRICLRKGRTFTHAGGEEIKFRSQAKAKACSDALNEQFWDANKKALQNDTYPPDALAMRELIRTFED